jgi:2,3-bisphosphoglycerate-dependent phosphoglycerate mutase
MGTLRVGLPSRDRTRWTDRGLLVIGRTATRWAFDHLIDGEPIEDLVAAPFTWQEGWEYCLR